MEDIMTLIKGFLRKRHNFYESYKVQVKSEAVEHLNEQKQVLAKLGYSG